MLVYPLQWYHIDDVGKESSSKSVLVIIQQVCRKELNLSQAARYLGMSSFFSFSNGKWNGLIYSDKGTDSLFIFFNWHRIHFSEIKSVNCSQVSSRTLEYFAASIAPDWNPHFEIINPKYAPESETTVLKACTFSLGIGLFQYLHSQIIFFISSSGDSTKTSTSTHPRAVSIVYGLTAC